MQVEGKRVMYYLKLHWDETRNIRGLPAVIILNSLLAAYHVNKTKKKHKVRTRMKQNTGERRNSAQVREEAKRTREKKTSTHESNYIISSCHLN